MENDDTLYYDDLDKIINIKDTFRKIEQSIFILPRYKDGSLYSYQEEIKTFKLEGIKSAYTLKDIMSPYFDKNIRLLFFKNIKNRCIELGLTHFHSLKLLVIMDSFDIEVIIRGFVDDYTKLIDKKIVVLENISEILDTKKKNDEMK